MPGPGGTGTIACWQLGEEGMNPRGRKQSLQCLLLGRKDSLPCSPSLEAQISLPKTPPGGHGLGQGSGGVPRCLSPWSHSGAEKSRKRDFCLRATEKIGRFLTKKKPSSSLGSFGVTLNRILSISYSRVKPLEQASLALTTSSEGSPLPLPQSAAVRFRGQ